MAAAANGVEWRPRGPIQGKMGLSGGIQGFLSFFSGLGFSAFFSLLSQLSSSSSSAQLWALRHLLPIDGALGHVPTCPYASLEPQTQR